MVRTHNIEHDYYRGLIGNAPILKRLFFWWESIKLKKYEPILRHATWLLAIKPSDATHFKSFNQQTIVIPAVLPLESTIAKREKTEPFVLFHGNLSVIENDLGARWIIRALDELLTVDFPLVIAGKNPSQELIRCADGKRIKIFANPDESEMQNLIAGARVHALYSDVGSGTKLKFLSSLSANGHVLVNTAVAGDIPKNEYFHVADDAVSFARVFSTIYDKKLSALQIAKRREWLQSVFGAKNTVQKISDLFSDEKMRDHH